MSQTTPSPPQTTDWRSLPRKRKYLWPTDPQQEQIFPIGPHEDLNDAQTRILNAARMKFQHRRLGWGFRTKRTGEGISFMWLLPTN